MIWSVHIFENSLYVDVYDYACVFAMALHNLHNLNHFDMAPLHYYYRLDKENCRDIKNVTLVFYSIMLLPIPKYMLSNIIKICLQNL